MTPPEDDFFPFGLEFDFGLLVDSWLILVWNIVVQVVDFCLGSCLRILWIFQLVDSGKSDADLLSVCSRMIV